MQGFNDSLLLKLYHSPAVVKHGFPVGDDHDGLVGEALQVLEKAALRGFVEGAGGFIQQQDGGAGEDRPGDGDALHLAFGKAQAALTEGGVQIIHKIAGAGDLERLPYPGVIMCSLRIGKAYDLADGPVHQGISLGDVGKEAAKLCRQGPAVDIALPAIQRIQAQQKLQDRGFAAAAPAGEGHAFALFDLKVEVVKDRRLCPIRRELSRCVFGRSISSLIRKPRIPQPQHGKRIAVVGEHRAEVRAGFVIRKALRFHQAFGACQHGVPLGHKAADIGKRRLDLTGQMHDGGHGAVAHRAGQNAVRAVDDAGQDHAVHGRAEADIAKVREAVPRHAGVLVRLHFLRGFGPGLRLAGVGFDQHQVGNALLKEDAQAPVAFLDPLVHAL